MPQNRAVPESSDEDRTSTVTACAGRDAIQHWAHGTKTLEKTFEERDTPNQAVVRIVNGTAEPGASSMRLERLSLLPRPSRRWRCRWNPSNANVRKFCRVKDDQQSEISLARRKPQDCDSVEQQSSAQDPGAHSQPKLEDVTSKESFDKVKIRVSEINKHVSDGINKDHETQMGRRSSASPKLNW